MSEIQVSTQATNVTLSWPKPFDGFSDILRYDVTYREHTSSNLKKVNDTSNYTTVHIVGLIPYTTYIAKIIPVSQIGAAENADEFKFTTNVSGTFLFMMLYSTCNNTDTVSAPSAPRNLAINATSSTTFLLHGKNQRTLMVPSMFTMSIYKLWMMSEKDKGGLHHKFYFSKTCL